MARAFISPNSKTNKTIDAIDRKREKERRFMLTKARDNAATLSVKLVQKLMDNNIIDTTSDRAIKELFEKQLAGLINIDEFDMRFKVAPIRTLTSNPNLISLYLTQYIVEDLLEHPKIKDIYGDDLDVYKVVDSVISTIKPS